MLKKTGKNNVIKKPDQVKNPDLLQKKKISTGIKLGISIGISCFVIIIIIIVLVIVLAIVSINSAGKKAEEAKRRAREAEQQIDEIERDAQKSLDKQSAENVASNFMVDLPNVYSDQANTWASARTIAAKYWTNSGMSYFDSYYQQYFASEVFYTGGTIHSAERISDNKYKVLTQENEVFYSEDGESSPGSNQTYFIVEKVNDKWLITSHDKR